MYFSTSGRNDGDVQGFEFQPQAHVGAGGRVQPSPAPGEGEAGHRVDRGVGRPTGGGGAGGGRPVTGGGWGRAGEGLTSEPCSLPDLTPKTRAQRVAQGLSASSLHFYSNYRYSSYIL